MIPVFEKISGLYAKLIMEPAWQSCPNCETDPWDSLRLLLMNYAFERQGRPEDFAHVAVDVVDELRGRAIDEETAEIAWELFTGKLGQNGLNYSNNPLCPKGVSYNRKYLRVLKSAKVGKISVLQLAARDLDGLPMVPWARRLIEQDNVAEAHGCLRGVNGIGSKIASYFLRDVALKFGLAPCSSRELLQPIDGWVRLVVRILSNTGLGDPECAAYLVANSSSPERANQGIWYFCAHVAGSSGYLVRKSLADRAYLEGLFLKHLNRMKGEAQIAEEFQQEWE